MKCPYPSCLNELNAAATECARCSRKVRTCTECHWTNRALAKYCRRCGKVLAVRTEWPLGRRDTGSTACVPTGVTFDALGQDSLRGVWPSHRVGAERGQVLTPITAEHGLLAVCSSTGRLTIVNRYTGMTLAETQIEANVQEAEFSAAFHEHFLVAGGASTLRCFNLLHGFQGWQTTSMPLVQEWQITLTGEQVYRPVFIAPRSTDVCVLAVTQADGESRIHCVSLQTGRNFWPKPMSLPLGISAVVGGEGFHAYLLAEDGRVHSIDIASGGSQASAQMRKPPRLDLPPVWRDDTLFFFDAEGALCTCPTSGAIIGVPSRTSDQTLQVVTGYAVAPYGVLVSCSRGLAMLSRTGRRLWIGEGNMDAVGSAPVVAGDIALGIGQNHGVLYVCDLKASPLRYRPIHLSSEAFVSSPALADNILYTSSISGEVFSIRIDGS